MKRQYGAESCKNSLELIWVCPENFKKIMKGYGDRNFEWSMYSKRFCESSNYYWPDVRDMIQEYSGGVITCDCHVIEAKVFI
jgi:hypothetical protein